MQQCHSHFIISGNDNYFIHLEVTLAMNHNLVLISYIRMETLEWLEISKMHK